MTALAPRPDGVCRCCNGPLIRVSDDPHDPEGTTHPGCDPVDPQRWEQFLRDTPVQRAAREKAGRERKAYQR